MTPETAAWLKEGERVLRDAREACPEFRELLRLAVRGLARELTEPKVSPDPYQALGVMLHGHPLFTSGAKPSDLEWMRDTIRTMSDPLFRRWTQAQ